MRNKPMCDNCTFWKETLNGRVGACKMQQKVTKWCDTCREHVKFIKKEEPENV
jgi:ribosomal protein L33